MASVGGFRGGCGSCLPGCCFRGGSLGMAPRAGPGGVGVDDVDGGDDAGAGEGAPEVLLEPAPVPASEPPGWLPGCPPPCRCPATAGEPTSAAGSGVPLPLWAADVSAVCAWPDVAGPAGAVVRGGSETARGTMRQRRRPAAARSDPGCCTAGKGASCTHGQRRRGGSEPRHNAVGVCVSVSPHIVLRHNGTMVRGTGDDE